MKGFFRFLHGMIWGLAIGAILALLWTPKSGQKLRQAIMDYVNYIIEEGRRAGEARRRELEQEFEQMRRGR